ncbi:Alkaline-phosphatase-like, core domain,Alkaline phosphatase-like, alpha/beta/alpha,Sulfatase, N- [Cinara cedri]|uniref:Alkaline-phosphatase-like, core domain,Alkaline phosphatase-like, alpha/beta/alpha,Sulfatase, N n=1 Tax=Cinara cedri TaxID=506608 RepID=A0A5E4N0W2_9HEMI|nr:Alkaline-phosphatase-like, core domain,Alkaline phosphatase-like, alpha/beta/alpha,Sulfatase, N- [Cinara cedri]
MKDGTASLVRLLGTLVAVLPAARPQITRPNIVFILADDLGWNDLSFHGSDEIQTPNIDALAFNGVVLNNLYTQPVCTPSRVALMTGKYPIKLGMQGPPTYGAEPNGLPLTEKLFPEYFRELGYTTRAVGKWHLGFFRSAYTPTRRGFDSHFGYYTGFVGYYDYILQDTYRDFGEFSGFDLRRNDSFVWDAVGKYATDVFTDEAVRLIKEQPANRPLFMYLAHLAVHTGNKGKYLEAPQSEINKFKHIADPNRRTYAAMVSKLDESVGRVVQALEAKNMLHNTIIVLMSDNGSPSYDDSGRNFPPNVGITANWGSNFPYRGVKNTLWQGGVKSASLIWTPRFQQNPRVSQQLMHITDWLPTLYSAAGGNPGYLPKDMDGLDQWMSLTMDLPSRRNYLLLNIDEKLRYAGIVKDNWKLIVGSTANGSLDGFFGTTRPRVPYNATAVVYSHVGRALARLWDTLPYAFGGTSVRDVLALRYDSTVRCNRPKAGPRTRTPCTAGEVCLFNLVADPCETNNVAKKHFTVSTQLYEALKYYKRLLIPQTNRPFDPAANPARFNNTWSSWVY